MISLVKLLVVGDKNIVRRVKLFCADGSYPVSLGFGLFLEGGGVGVMVIKWREDSQKVCIW